MEDASDEALIVYAHGRNAILVTTNRDCAQLARRMQLGSTVWLAVREVDAAVAMDHAIKWLAEH